MNIGFIGLGIMGKPMCINLLKKGHSVYICSSNDDTNEELAGYGANVTKDREAVAAKSEVIILMLPDSAEVQEVIVDSGLYKKFNPETTVVDMSSINPETSKAVFEAINAHGHQYIDAPVSGGEEKAVAGTLSIMAGGDEEEFEAVRPILEGMGTSIVHTGPVGSGNAVKLVNQVIVANNIAALSEGVALAEEMELDLDTVYDAISGGLAGSAVMEAKFRKMAEDEYRPGFKMKLHMKDLNNAFASVDGSFIENLCITGRTKEIMSELMEEASIQEEDHSALYRYYRKKDR
ncbi:NAD(P)-binding domain-containing protein [Lacicoccus alkaliphilus]|uniref:2-hydroxy-3-oxopropionate reductase n=1 Tax=Lacicoccus alkaliphilus DSM 16010 TaxID=1123231 RepID=A0A1M7BRR9_9BACL|nr:NAD(P)-binding domain-containing protein [Salinicoccus alkaliphilus]SHL57660.1 2-hydroxy-3-oxopropionate reductase [Salinicoccus alkaliphilus DSM 16010]